MGSTNNTNTSGSSNPSYVGEDQTQRKSYSNNLNNSQPMPQFTPQDLLNMMYNFQMMINGQSSSEKINALNAMTKPDQILIFFNQSAGQKYQMYINSSDLVKDILAEFLNKLGFKLNIEKLSVYQIIFTFNAINLSKFLNKKACEINLINNSRINVIDTNNLIGGLK